MVRILALVGEAGTGKDTLLHELVKQFPDKYKEIISCTTRPSRQGEQDGVNYYFLSYEEFNNRKLCGDMLESTWFNGWFYGTSKQELVEDKINVGVFNPQGIYDIMDNHPEIELRVARITCLDKIRLIRQLEREDYPDIKEIIRRYQADEVDFRKFDHDRGSHNVFLTASNDLPIDLQEIVYLLDTTVKFS